jgi:LPS sulfotransferase NodH
VIVGVARTGSTLLVNLLNSHPHTLVFGELFRSADSIGWDVSPFARQRKARDLALYRTAPLAFLRKRVFRRWPGKIAAVGFKLFYYHARTHPFSAVWEYLVRDPEVLVLHIKRKNILEQFLSLRLAHMTEVWSSEQKKGKVPGPIRLEADACLLHFEQVRAQEAACDAFFEGHPVIAIYYEDLMKNAALEMQRVQRFLGLNVKPLIAETRRQRTEPVWHAIANYDELKAIFGKSEWAEFFVNTTGDCPVRF